MKQNFQKQLLDIAGGLCLFDSYLTLAGVETFEDKLFYLMKARTKNIVDEDGYVNDADRLYNEVLGQCKKVIKSYTYDGTDNVVACWDNYHFTIVDKDGNMVYDPLGPRGNKYSNITSYRIVS